jgi:hypothetical protein
MRPAVLLVQRFLMALCVVAACDDAPPQHANAARPMDEPRAQQIIAKTFQSEGVDAEPDRTVTLVASHPVKLEVAATGHKFGVVWLTRDLAHDLAALLPKHDNDEGSLVVLDGMGRDVGAHVLALWETDYMTDDLAGVSHSSTEIAAELKLARDVRDFLVKAKAEQWP